MISVHHNRRFCALPPFCPVLAEFDFRYYHRAWLGYSDENRTIAAIRAREGKRLTHRQPN
jgi:hypothetical protein